MNSIVIGFTGGTGSGKTTLAQRLNEVFKNNSVIIKQDSYYKDFPDKSFEERVMINYDHPDSFDMGRFTDDVRRLKAGETIECPVYNYAEYKRDEDAVTVEPKRIIILEGLFLFENPALSDLIDVKVFVDTDADVRILRRIIRDVKEREAGVSIPSFCSTLRQSNRCTKGLSSRKRNAPTSSCRKADITRLPLT